MKWMFALFVVMFIGLAGTFIGNPEKPKPNPKGILIAFKESHYKLIQVDGGGTEENNVNPADENTTNQDEFKNGCIKYANFFQDVYKFLFWLGFTGVGGGLGGLLAFHYKKYKDKKERIETGEEKIETAKAEKKEKAETDEEKKETEKKKKKEYNYYLYLNVIIGIGGAWGITLLMMIAKKYTFELTLLEVLIIWLFSFIAGFLGDEIITLTSDLVLKGLGKKVDKVEKDMLKIRDETNDSKDEIKKAEKEIKIVSNRTNAVRTEIEGMLVYANSIDINLKDASPGDLYDNLVELENHRTQEMSDKLTRRIYITLGRFCKAYSRRDQNYLHKAIEYLKEYLTKNNYPAEINPKQIKNAIYNLGCYYSLLIEDESSIKYKDTALKYLHESLKMDKYFIEYMKQDPDLENLKKYFEQEYKNLINES